ncbi:hypothetical protein MtrunA17_Chr7g0265951 [Medicago truncatula]|uniref:Uncharacterized protein n=1 Tax=Medicago truncatula TaxID=3880 RepID=A0A396H5T3_MEDTR|nr:hypothetical protein MtrunA17_Chr7g0265951 [Medicago truncatula]
MGSVYQRLKIFWSSKPTARCKEISNMLPKASIVRMFLDSHNLDSIIAKLFNARQYIISKIGICVDFWLLHHMVQSIINNRNNTASK